MQKLTNNLPRYFVSRVFVGLPSTHKPLENYPHCISSKNNHDVGLGFRRRNGGMTRALVGSIQYIVVKYFFISAYLSIVFVSQTAENHGIGLR